MLLPLLLAAMMGYLLGSLPFGYLVARAKGVNIFEVGSRNPGATNVRRVLGSGPGNLVFTLDALKGMMATSWALLRYSSFKLSAPFGSSAPVIEGELWTQLGVAGLIGALLGHSFSCFTKFRGGKGVATSIGGLVVLMPAAAVLATVTWVVVFYASRYVSLASIVAAVALVVASFALRSSSLLNAVAILIAGFVIIRHRANILRLLNGTENKFVKKSSPSKT